VMLAFLSTPASTTAQFSPICACALMP
jgi:hypothetical protein